jgi:hypothetical protein
VNYARRQQYRRLLRAGGATIGSTAAVLLALGVSSDGATSPAAVLLVVAVGFGFSARRWLGLAKGSRIGARSEDEVRHQLAALQHEGWSVRHSLPLRRGGDIDSVAIAPSGLAFAIETKSRTYDERHLGIVREQAAWLRRCRRRWCRCGALPVLCVVRAVGIQRWERGVLVVSLEALIPTLRLTAAEALHPSA